MYDVKRRTCDQFRTKGYTTKCVMNNQNIYDNLYSPCNELSKVLEWATVFGLENHVSILPSHPGQLSLLPALGREISTV